MYKINVFTPCTPCWSSAPFTTMFSLSVSFLPKSIAKKVERVIMPRPPICIRNSMISRPIPEKSAPVSFTISPVTHVALVEVKNASTIPIEAPLAEHWGRDKRLAPMTIVIRKLNITTCGGFSLRIIKHMSLRAKRSNLFFEIASALRASQ